jgi:hypothetical protein
MRMLSEVLTGARTCPTDCAICGRLRESAAAAVLMADGSAVTMVELAAAAGVPASKAAAHCPEGAARVVADAYRRAAGELFGEYAASLRLVDSWPEKLTTALQRLLRRLASEPAMAHLCFVAPTSGDPELREIREAFRVRYVALLQEEQRRDGSLDVDARLPNLQVELMVGGVFRTIADLVGDGRAPELPSLLEDVAGAAQVFEPRVPVTA